MFTCATVAQQFVRPESSSTVIVIIGSKSVPIRNSFHARRANSGKMTTLDYKPGSLPFLLFYLSYVLNFLPFFIFSTFSIFIISFFTLEKNRHKESLLK